jgi:putative oxidoreductase
VNQAIPAQAVDPHAAPLGILVLRLALASMWLSHAMLKLIVFTLPGTAQFFESVGLPGALAYPVFAAEVLGGVMILLGIYGRQVSLLLLPILLVAAWVHLPNGWVHTSKGGGWEYPVFLVIASLTHWLLGDGAYALKISSRFTPSSIKS